MPERKEEKKGMSGFLIFLGMIFVIAAAIPIGRYIYDGYVSEQGLEKAAEFVVPEAEYRDAVGKADVDPDDLMDINAMKYVNPDTYGYLKVQDKGLPVVRNDDPAKYLKTGWDGSKTANGTVFMDPACDEDSKNIVLYGHHMKSGRMFGELKKYLNEDYRNENMTFKWITEGYVDTFEVMAVAELHAASLNGLLDMGLKSDLDKLTDTFTKSGKLYGEFTSNATYMTLSTCEYDYADGRLFVIGKRISHAERPDAKEGD